MREKWGINQEPLQIPPYASELMILEMQFRRNHSASATLRSISDVIYVHLISLEHIAHAICRACVCMRHRKSLHTHTLTHTSALNRAESSSHLVPTRSHKHSYTFGVHSCGCRHAATLLQLYPQPVRRCTDNIHPVFAMTLVSDGDIELRVNRSHKMFCK